MGYIEIIMLVFKILTMDLNSNGIADSLELFQRLFGAIGRAPVWKRGAVVRQANRELRSAIEHREKYSAFTDATGTPVSTYLAGFVHGLELEFPAK